MRECGEEFLSNSEDDKSDTEAISTNEALKCVAIEVRCTYICCTSLFITHLFK